MANWWSFCGRWDLDAEILEALGPALAGQVVTRQGKPFKVADLVKVAAGRASTVVVLAPEAGSGGGGAGGGSGAGGGGSAGGRSASHPDKERYVDGHEALSPEALQALTLSSLAILRADAAAEGGLDSTKPQLVLAQRTETLDLVLAARAAQGRKPGTAGDTVYVGYGEVASALLRHSAGGKAPKTAKFYVHHVPGLAGLTYGEARQLFPRALLCGLLSPASSGVAGPAAAPDTSLNPPEVTLIDPEDDLIFLATSRRDLLPDAAALGEARRQVEERERLGLPLKGAPKPRPLTAAERAAAREAVPPVRVVVLAFSGEQLTTLVDALGTVLLLGGDRADAAQWERRCSAVAGSRLRVKSMAASPRSAAALAEADAANADAIIIAGLEEADAHAADAQALVTLLQLKTLLADSPLPYVLPQPPPQPPQQAKQPAAPAADEAPAAGASAPCGTGDVDIGNQGGTALTAAAPVSSSPSESPAAPPPPLPPPPPPPPKPLTLVCHIRDPGTRYVVQTLAGDGSGRPSLLSGATSSAHSDAGGGTDIFSLFTGGGGGGGSSGGGGGGTGLWERGLHVEAVHPEHLLTDVLTEVAGDPRLEGVYRELASAAGNDLFLRAPAQLGLPVGSPLSLQQVCDKVRERGSTYLGILRGEQLATRGSGGGSGSSSRSVGSGNGSSSVGGTAQAGSRREGVGAEQRRLSLGLPHEGPGAVVTLQPGDRLVVLAVR
eukprot:XP_001692067.1 predicted protein [Chlamydomonas reinhardtii]